MDSPFYPAPMVDHTIARQRALTTYSSGLGRGD
jgi:deoxyribodipyrimidine photolyase